MSKRYQGGILGVGFNPLQAPNAPTNPAATAGAADSGEVSVSFTPPTNVGGAAISAYYAIGSDGLTRTGSSSPIVVTGLSTGTSYTFTVWALNSYGPSPLSATTNSATPVASRGVFAGGATSASAATVTIDYVSIATLGNASSFGSLATAFRGLAGCSSATIGLFGGGQIPSGGVNQSSISYVTIATTGNAASFGNLTSARTELGACSSSTRGIFAGGYTGTGTSVNTIDYVTIASAGNATSFGQLSVARYGVAGCSSPTRGVFGGGTTSGGSGGRSNVIDYITIATTGNATDFGDLTKARFNLAACSSSTRAVFAGGDEVYVFPTGSMAATIDYVTIATTGNAVSFGSLTAPTGYIAGCSNATRGLFGGGLSNGGVYLNTIEYITIASASSSVDFGDLTVGRSTLGACSNAHGGL